MGSRAATIVDSNRYTGLKTISFYYYSYYSYYHHHLLLPPPPPPPPNLILTMVLILQIQAMAWHTLDLSPTLQVMQPPQMHLSMWSFPSCMLGAMPTTTTITTTDKPTSDRTALSTTSQSLSMITLMGVGMALLIDNIL